MMPWPHAHSFSPQATLEKLHIPLLTLSMPPSAARKSVSTRILALASSAPLEATHIYANMSYEVDELQRDIKLLSEGRAKGMFVGLEHDKLIVPPFDLRRKTGKDAPYTVRRLTSGLVSSNLTLHHLHSPSRPGTRSGQAWSKRPPHCTGQWPILSPTRPLHCDSLRRRCGRCRSPTASKATSLTRPRRR